jgi:uridine kinase
MKKIIGISGVARSGKDTLGAQICTILRERNIKCRTTSFANALKQECNEFLTKTIGISAFTQDDEEKKIIRPLLVTWGTHVRRKLDENVWVKSVENTLSDDEVVIICDVRFPNELDWVKKIGGYSIYVERQDSDGNLIRPANQDEKENTVPLKSLCSTSITWPTISDEQWLVAIAYEVLNETVPASEFEKWIQTSP